MKFLKSGFVFVIIIFGIFAVNKSAEAFTIDVQTYLGGDGTNSSYPPTVALMPGLSFLVTGPLGFSMIGKTGIFGHWQKMGLPSGTYTLSFNKNNDPSERLFNLFVSKMVSGNILAGWTDGNTAWMQTNSGIEFHLVFDKGPFFARRWYKSSDPSYNIYAKNFSGSPYPDPYIMEVGQDPIGAFGSHTHGFSIFKGAEVDGSTIIWPPTVADGSFSKWEWLLVEKPSGSSVSFSESGSYPDMILVPDKAGIYGTKARFTHRSGEIVETPVYRQYASTVPMVAATSYCNGSNNIVLDASATVDPDGDALTYKWTEGSGGSGSVLQEGISPIYTLPASATTKDYTVIVYDLKQSLNNTTHSAGKVIPNFSIPNCTPVSYLLSVTKSGSGMGTVTGDPSGNGGDDIDCGLNCDALFNSGDVTLTPTPLAGSTFVSWSGDPDCSDGSVTMNANKTCTATFNLASMVLNTPSFTCSPALNLDLSWGSVAGASYYTTTINLYNGSVFSSGTENFTADFTTSGTTKSIPYNLISNIAHYGPLSETDPNFGIVGLIVKAKDFGGNIIAVSNEKRVFQRTPFNRIFGASLGSSVVPTANCLLVNAVFGGNPANPDFPPTNGSSWWTGAVDYTVTHLNTGVVYSGSSVDKTFTIPNTFNDTTENFTIHYNSGGPGTVLARISEINNGGNFESGQTFSAAYNTTGSWGGGFSLLFPPLPPSAPSVVAAATLCVADGQPGNPITWTDNSTDETGFNIYRNTSAFTTMAGGVFISSAAANTTNFTDPTPAAGVTYYYRVSAINAGGETIDVTSTQASAITANCSTPPTASFIVIPPSGTTSTTFNVDASGSSDLETSLADLQVRWDWENDGTWDTGWSTTKTNSHTYSTVGMKTIKMAVRDTSGSIDYTIRNITVNEIYINCGLRAYDGTGIVKFACEPAGALTSPLRLRKGGTTYSAILVDTTDSNASRVRIKTPSGVKALRRY